ncbi:MAG TPA: hypothetical protein VKA48_03440, partial [Gammaproteobacteria bacterium]|nr:hypothetical protein [Gammaproteobacteria bacterium]
QPKDQETDAEYWKRRFEVMEGKYQAEVPQLHHQLQASNERISQLQEKMDQLQQEPQSQQRDEPQADPSGLEDAIRNAESVYGEDNELVQALKAQQQHINTLEQRNERLAQQASEAANQVESVQQAQQKSQEDEFFDALNREVPDWKQLNEDPGYIQWLGQIEPYTGRPMLELLREARQSLDAPRVIAFFRNYKQAQGLESDPSAEKQRQQEQKKQERQRDLERRTAPPETRAGDTPQAAPHYSRERIAQVYKDYALGRMSDEEFAQHESAIREAQKNGTTS